MNDKIDAGRMKSSWLEAVASGEAEGFARHWMPDILDSLAASQSALGKAMAELAGARQDAFREAAYISQCYLAKMGNGRCENSCDLCATANIIDSKALAAPRVEPVKPCQCGSPILRWVHAQPPLKCGEVNP